MSTYCVPGVEQRALHVSLGPLHSLRVRIGLVGPLRPGDQSDVLVASHGLVNSLIKHLSHGRSGDVPWARQTQLLSLQGLYPRGRHVSHQFLGSTRATGEKLWELGSGKSPHRRAIDTSSSGGWEGCDRPRKQSRQGTGGSEGCGCAGGGVWLPGSPRESGGQRLGHQAGLAAATAGGGLTLVSQRSVSRSSCSPASSARGDLVHHTQGLEGAQCSCVQS